MISETIEWHSIAAATGPPNDNELLLQIRLKDGVVLTVTGWMDGHCKWHLHRYSNKCEILFWAQMPDGPITPTDS